MAVGDEDVADPPLADGGDQRGKVGIACGSGVDDGQRIAAQQIGIGSRSGHRRRIGGQNDRQIRLDLQGFSGLGWERGLCHRALSVGGTFA